MRADTFIESHATRRAKQRGIPPLIEYWLDEYGEEDYDGHGGCRIFFSKRSIRRMEQDFGRAPVRKMSEWHRAYKVIDSHDGHVITVGHRFRRLRRK